jgi:hypothetical protein
LKIFDKKTADILPFIWKKGIDYYIKFEWREDKIKLKILWRFIYNILRDKLLILRKILTKLLNKKFIRISNSPVAALILFI